MGRNLACFRVFSVSDGTIGLWGSGIDQVHGPAQVSQLVVDAGLNCRGHPPSGFSSLSNPPVLRLEDLINLVEPLIYSLEPPILFWCRGPHVFSGGFYQCTNLFFEWLAGRSWLGLLWKGFLSTTGKDSYLW